MTRHAPFSGLPNTAPAGLFDPCDGELFLTRGLQSGSEHSTLIQGSARFLSRHQCSAPSAAGGIITLFQAVSNATRMPPTASSAEIVPKLWSSMWSREGPPSAAHVFSINLRTFWVAVMRLHHPSLHRLLNGLAGNEPWVLLRLIFGRPYRMTSYLGHGDWQRLEDLVGSSSSFPVPTRHIFSWKP
jgi:hypothetical protein